MRIGLLTTSYPRTKRDTAGHFVRGFARALAARGHELEVLAPAPGTAAPALRDPGVRVVHVRYATPQGAQQLFYGAGVPENLARKPWLAPQLVTFSAALALASRKRAAGWDAVISHWAVPCGVVAAGLGLPHLSVCHSADVHALRRLPLGAALRRHVQQGARAMWFVAPGHRDSFMVPEGVAPRVHVGPMGIDAMAPAQRREGPYLRVVSLGRLVPVKGLVHAIGAVRSLHGAELRIAGDGPCRRELVRAADGCPRIRLLGEVHGSEKAALLRDADAFVLPSLVLPDGRSEGVPCALLEAMHAGLPVVASDVGGVSSVVEHGTSGWLVPPGDEAAIADALRTLQENAPLADGLARSARMHAQRYLWPAQAERAETLLFT